MRAMLFILFLAATQYCSGQSLPILKPNVYDQKELSVAERDSIKRNAALYKRVIDKSDKEKTLTHEEKEFLDKLDEYGGEAPFDAFNESGYYYYIGIYGCNYYENGGPDTAWASSSLSKEHKIENIADETLDLAWAEGKPGSGIGETISFRMVKNAWPLENIIIYNGYQKEIGLWKRNNRVREMKLYVDGKAIALLSLADETGAQSFDVKKWFKQRKKPYLIKLEILSVYKGDKHEDTVISEIGFDGPSMH